MAWDVISERVGSLRRASLPCDELPPASAVAGEKVDPCGTEEETCPPIAKDLYGDTGMVGTRGPANTPDLGRKRSVCPEGKVEF